MLKGDNKVRAIVIYDSFFGNTEIVAKAIAAEFEDCKAVKVESGEELGLYDLIIFGSPTRGFRPIKSIADFIKENNFTDVKVAAFDTRIALEDTKNAFLKRMIKLFGYAAVPMTKLLKRRGGTVVNEPIGFNVADTKGPLKEGELEKAIQWARKMK